MWAHHRGVSPAALWDHTRGSLHGLAAGRGVQIMHMPSSPPGSGCAQQAWGACAVVLVEGLPSFFVRLTAISSFSLETFSAPHYDTTWLHCLQLFCSSLLGLLSSVILYILKNNCVFINVSSNLKSCWVSSAFQPFLPDAFLCHALLLHTFPAWFLWQHVYLSICYRSPSSCLDICYPSHKCHFQVYHVNKFSLKTKPKHMVISLGKPT